MDLSTYQKLSMRTLNPAPNAIESYFLGLYGEGGEVSDLLKKHIFHGHALDLEKLTLEIGDASWYPAAVASEMNLDLLEAYDAGTTIEGKDLQFYLSRYMRNAVRVEECARAYIRRPDSAVFKNDLKYHLGNMIRCLENVCALTGIDYAVALDKNVEKLQKRYADGFSQAASVGRVA